MSEDSQAIQCAELLIRAGADFNVIDVYGDTPLMNSTVFQLKEKIPELFQKN